MSFDPSPGPLIQFLFSPAYSVYFVPLFLVSQLASQVLLQELGEEDNYQNYFSHPFKPLNVQPRTKSELGTPFLAVFFSPVIIFPTSYLQFARRLNYFPEMLFCIFRVLLHTCSNYLILVVNLCLSLQRQFKIRGKITLFL